MVGDTLAIGGGCAKLVGPVALIVGDPQVGRAFEDEGISLHRDTDDEQGPGEAFVGGIPEHLHVGVDVYRPGHVPTESGYLVV